MLAGPLSDAGPLCTGRLTNVAELAREYGFTDIDGRRVPPFRIRESFVNMVKKFNISHKANRTK